MGNVDSGSSGEIIPGNNSVSQDVRMVDASNFLGKRTADDSTSGAAEVEAHGNVPLSTAVIPFVGNNQEKSPESTIVAEKVSRFEGELESEDNNQNIINTPQKNAKK